MNAILDEEDKARVDFYTNEGMQLRKIPPAITYRLSGSDTDVKFNQTIAHLQISDEAGMIVGLALVNPIQPQSEGWDFALQNSYWSQNSTNL